MSHIVPDCTTTRISTVLPLSIYTYLCIQQKLNAMNTENLRLALSNCFKLTHLASVEVDLVNYINEGYQCNDLKIGNNSFLKLTAINYYHSSILKLSSLFGGVTKNNKNSFLQFIGEKVIWANLNNKNDVIEILKWNAVNSVEIKNLRDKLIAHQDFEDYPNLKYNVEHLEGLNEMVAGAKQIIDLVSKETDNGYLYAPRNQYLFSLERIVDSMPTPIPRK